MSCTKKLPPPLESEVQASAIDILEGLGWEVCVRKVGAVKVGDRFIRFEKPGRSDLYGTVGGGDGRHFEIEVKRPKEKPTLTQIAWLISHNNEHNVAFWCDNVDTLKFIASWVMAGCSIVFEADGTFDLVD